MRQIDPHVKEGVKPSSWRQCQKGIYGFLTFLAWYRLNPEDSLEMDEHLVEYKNDSGWGGGNRNPKNSKFESCLAGVEKAVPAPSGLLTQAHRVLRSWRVVVGVSHTVPMSRPWVLLLSRWLSQVGQPRVGAILLIQYVQRMRPSEPLDLFAEHFGE